MWLAQGNLSAAIQWARENGLKVDDDLDYERQVEYLTLVRVLLAQKKPDRAIRLLNRLIESAEQAGRTGETVEMLALKALAHQVQNETDVAENVLEKALVRAEAGEYIRTFIDVGESMKVLLLAVGRQRLAVSKTYLAKLLAAFDAANDLQSAVVSSTPASPISSALIEPLSERELEVLHLIVGGATNQEIAQALFITVNTVKKHVSNIFGKLGVSRRPQAIARARELGFITE